MKLLAKRIINPGNPGKEVVEYIPIKFSEQLLEDFWIHIKD